MTQRAENVAIGCLLERCFSNKIFEAKAERQACWGTVGGLDASSPDTSVTVRLDWIVAGVDAQGTGKLLPPRVHTPVVPPTGSNLDNLSQDQFCHPSGVSIRTCEIGAVVKKFFFSVGNNVPWAARPNAPAP